MLMERQKCKLCWKQFANGKALGGHMRSHLAPLPLPPKTPPQKQDSGERQRCVDQCKSTLFSLDDEGKGDEKQGGSCYRLRESPSKSFRLVDPEFLDAESVVPVQETENETESTTKPTRRRSKRTRRFFVVEENKESEDQGAKNNDEMVKTAKLTESESLPISFCDEEDIARSLLMLSNDVWEGSETMKQGKTSKNKENFQCEICNGLFKCSQALGSHRTAHRNKMMINAGEFDPQKPRNLGVKIESHRVHECPFCGKIFGSGQALGGHKRSHLFNSPSGSGSSSCSSKLDESLVDSNPENVPKTMIDLNLPAAVEEDK